MPGYINKSGNYRMEEFGVVHINVKSTARTVRIRWKGGGLHISAPTGIAYDSLIEIMRRNSPSIESSRPQAMYHEGQVFDFGCLRIHIRRQKHDSSRIFANMSNGTGYIEVGDDWNMDSRDTIKTISNFMCRMAQRVAPGELISRARQLAAKVGKAPLMWTISNGHRTLGHCDGRGVIALSYCLVFYPQHLRDFVVYHELAHLSEMNHSPRFHQICDTYCEGREKALIAEMKAFKLPVIR